MLFEPVILGIRKTKDKTPKCFVIVGTEYGLQTYVSTKGDPEWYRVSGGKRIGKADEDLRRFLHNDLTANWDRIPKADIERRKY